MSHITLTLVDDREGAFLFYFFPSKGRWLKRGPINMTSPSRCDYSSTLTIKNKKEEAYFVYNTMPYQCVIVMHGSS